MYYKIQQSITYTIQTTVIKGKVFRILKIRESWQAIVLLLFEISMYNLLLKGGQSFRRDLLPNLGTFPRN